MAMVGVLWILIIPLSCLMKRQCQVFKLERVSLCNATSKNVFWFAFVILSLRLGFSFLTILCSNRVAFKQAVQTKADFFKKLIKLEFYGHI
jgi:hypothetical protein